jgi:hypothetical protein
LADAVTATMKKFLPTEDLLFLARLNEELLCEQMLRGSRVAVRVVARWAQRAGLFRRSAPSDVSHGS